MPFANQISHPVLRAPVRRADKTMWRPRTTLAASVGRIIAAILAGFAAAGEAMHPCLAPVRESDPRRSEASGAAAQEDAPPATSLRSIWSALSRNREDRRNSAAWEVLDDRTLRDIGVSRYEIESFTRLRPAGRHHDPRR
jgi:uncharacterized protein YjiS (DUF1127 family)